MNKTKQNVLLLLGVVVLAVVPLFMYPSRGTASPEDGKSEPFTGADSQAEALITEINPDYKPWYSSLWEPPSGEIESLLFALQAAVGSGLLFYYIGYHRGKSGKAKPE